MKITAFKSMQDGKLFESRDSYKKHLITLRKNRAEEFKIKRIVQSADLFLQEMYQVQSMNELEQFINDHAREFVIRSIVRAGQIKQLTKKTLEENYISNVELTARFFPTVSNTHSCPLNGVTNFFGYRGPAELPRSYPGWLGRIKFTSTVSTELTSFGGVFDKSGINLGTGGGGRQLEYDIKLFCDDFPNMAAVETFNLISRK